MSEAYNNTVSKHDLEIAIIKEKLAEIKDDKEKASKTFLWAGGIIFTIIMSVAGFGIQSNATIQVLQEKVKEQKDEINKLNIYIQDVHGSLLDELDTHDH